MQSLTRIAPVLPKFPGLMTAGGGWLRPQCFLWQAGEGRIVAAICAAPAVVLASLGLLDGRKATCYPANAFTGVIKDDTWQYIR